MANRLKSPIGWSSTEVRAHRRPALLFWPQVQPCKDPPPPGGWEGGVWDVASPGQPNPPLHGRKIVLRQKMKLIKGAGNLRPILGTQTCFLASDPPPPTLTHGGAVRDRHGNAHLPRGAVQERPHVRAHVAYPLCILGHCLRRSPPTTGGATPTGQTQRIQTAIRHFEGEVRFALTQYPRVCTE